MKLLPSPSIARRKMHADDGLVMGTDAALTMLAFFGIGFGLDRWLGTTPWLTITFSMLAFVGLFVSWKARYTARMEALEAQRRSSARTDDAGRHRTNADIAGSSES